MEPAPGAAHHAEDAGACQAALLWHAPPGLPEALRATPCANCWANAHAATAAEQHGQEDEVPGCENAGFLLGPFLPYGG